MASSRPSVAIPEPDLWLVALAPGHKLLQDILTVKGKMPTKPFGFMIGSKGEYTVVIAKYGTLLCIEASTRKEAGHYIRAMGNANLHAVAAIKHQGCFGDDSVRLVNPDREIEIVSGGYDGFTNGISSFVISPTATATERALRKVTAGQLPADDTVPVTQACDLPLAIAFGLIRPAR